ncbi:hypothetical protein NDU88_001465 [Pleurodeles waltl]|uniref:Uncharacterized protein n=1 Tax=Pleurodeles waltl TaxID=8319 RepID=A0AAV7P6R7_PLEWA|nr:hypothetical protein NDU88_001465 [Pleurodeles waltl]
MAPFLRACWPWRLARSLAQQEERPCSRKRADSAGRRRATTQGARNVCTATVHRARPRSRGLPPPPRSRSPWQLQAHRDVYAHEEVISPTHAHRSCLAEPRASLSPE